MLQEPHGCARCGLILIFGRGEPKTFLYFHQVIDDEVKESYFCRKCVDEVSVLVSDINGVLYKWN